MTYNVIDLKCPGCGGPARTDQKYCKFCGRQVVISSFNSVNNMTSQELNKYANTYKKALNEHPDDVQLNFSIGMCYLKLKLYDKALLSFEKSIEDNFDNSEAYFYAAACLLKGKKAFLAVREDIDKIESYIQAAISIEPRGIYYYFQSYIKYDYFTRKFFKTSPTYLEAFQQAQLAGMSNYDVIQFYEILGVEQPSCL